jgi:hypothetical protein
MYEGYDGYARLAQSMILLALREGRVPGFDTSTGPKKSYSRMTDEEKTIARDARRWLLDPNKTEFWCSWLKRSPHDLARMVKQKLGGHIIVRKSDIK